jgi:hypothetical protein
MKMIVIGLLSNFLFLNAASFEAATVKPANPDAAGSSGEDGRNGSLNVYNVTLKRCIRYAYGISAIRSLAAPNGLITIDMTSWRRQTIRLMKLNS